MRFSMKKFTRAFMALVLAFPISFCGGGGGTPTDPGGGPPPPTPPPPVVLFAGRETSLNPGGGGAGFVRDITATGRVEASITFTPADGEALIDVYKYHPGINPAQDDRCWQAEPGRGYLPLDAVARGKSPLTLTFRATAGERLTISFRHAGAGATLNGMCSA